MTRENLMIDCCLRLLTGQLRGSLAIVVSVGLLSATAQGDTRLPPPNPFLADSSQAVFHADPSQTNASRVPRAGGYGFIRVNSAQ